MFQFEKGVRKLQLNGVSNVTDMNGERRKVEDGVIYVFKNGEFVRDTKTCGK